VRVFRFPRPRPWTAALAALLAQGAIAGCCDCGDDDDDDSAVVGDDDDSADPGPAPGFAEVADFTIATGGAGPCAIVVTALDDDGIPDLAVSHLHSSTVSVFFGRGDGSFLGAWHEFDHLGPVLAGQDLGVVATGRFDDDSASDLAVASTGTDEVIVLLSPGQSIATTGFDLTAYPVGRGPFGVAAADLDGDGTDDLAVTGGEDNDVTILLRVPAGTFEERGRFDAGGEEPGFVVVADLDADGTPDLVTTNHSSSSVGVLRGLGDGSFEEAVAYPVGDGPSSPEIVDLDGDGDLDLLTANEDTDDISLLLGDGGGGFTVGESLAFGSRPYFVDSFDVDGDGDLDLVIPLEGEDLLVVALNDGAGGFDDVLHAATGREPVTVVHADFDGDGDDDVAVTNFRDDTLSVFLNRFEP